MAQFADFVPLLLRALNAPNTPQNRLFLQLWQRAEGGSAANNPFNTTEGSPGATNYNSVGVKNFPTSQAGLRATVATLENGRYGNIIDLLRSGHATAKQEGTALADSPWGTGSGVLRLLGSGPVPVPHAGSAPTPVPSPGSTSPDVYKQLVSDYLFQQAQASLSGKPDQQQGLGLLNLALARKAMGAAPSSAPHVSGPQAHPAAGDAAMVTGGHSPYANIDFSPGVDWQHVSPKLLQAINRIGQAYGTKITVNSGYRSNQHSVAVGGFAGDPHTKGLAVDAYINGKPVGDVIPPSVWQKLGITSGNVPNFYNGAPDPEHLQL